MKKVAFLFLLSLYWSLTQAQNRCQVKELYGDFVAISKHEINGQTYTSRQVLVPVKKSCLSAFIEQEKLMMDYLLTNFSSPVSPDLLAAAKDSLALRKIYLAELKKDSSFAKVMEELQTKVLEKKVAKDSIDMDDLMNVAMKYFTITKASADGGYSGKVCVGINGVTSTQTKRQAFLEAFAFSSIFKHYQSKEYNMYREFTDAIRKILPIQLGEDNNERLLRAQGALFVLMSQNEKLQKMLREEYEARKTNLPFILKPS
jgi:hypothetical protein